LGQKWIAPWIRLFKFKIHCLRNRHCRRARGLSIEVCHNITKYWTKVRTCSAAERFCQSAAAAAIDLFKSNALQFVRLKTDADCLCMLAFCVIVQGLVMFWINQWSLCNLKIEVDPLSLSNNPLLLLLFDWIIRWLTNVRWRGGWATTLCWKLG
jgi:hypothetical protein